MFFIAQPTSVMHGQDADTLLTAGGETEQEWIKMLMASPLFHQINDLQDMLTKSTGDGAQTDKVFGKQATVSIRYSTHLF